MASGHLKSPRQQHRGVWCIEGPWEDDLRSRGSVRPMLEMLESIGACSFVHRDVHTVAEAEFLLNEWRHKKRNAHWSILYLAGHGSASTIHFGRNQDMSLEHLAMAIGGGSRGRMVHFGACSMMRKLSAVREFMGATGVDHVTGYSRMVDWAQSAAFEVALFDALAVYPRVGDALNHIEQGPLAGLAQHLGFVRVGR